MQQDWMGSMRITYFIYGLALFLLGLGLFLRPQRPSLTATVLGRGVPWFALFGLCVIVVFGVAAGEPSGGASYALEQWELVFSLAALGTASLGAAYSIVRALRAVGGDDGGGAASGVASPLPETRYRAFFESAGDPILAVAGAGGPAAAVIDANEAALRMLGWSAEGIRGLAAERIIAPEVYEKTRRAMAAAADSGGSFLVETLWTTKAGARIQVEVSGRAVSVGGERVVVLTGRDITGRKRAEDEMRLLQRMTRAISEADDFDEALGVALRMVSDATSWHYGEAWTMNARTGALELSPAWYTCHTSLHAFRKESERFRFEPHVGLPGRVWASGRPEWIPDVSATSEKVFLRTSLALETGLKAALGIPIVASGEVLAVLVFFMFQSREEDRRLIELVSTVAAQLGVIIRRKHAEQALRASEERFREMAENIKEVFWMVSPSQRRLIYISPAYEKIWGRSSDALYSDLLSYIKAVHPEDRRRVARYYGGYTDGETLIEYRIVRPDGSVRHIRDRAFPVHGDDGSLTRLVGIAEDVTGLKESEREKREMEARLYQSQKLEAVGRLAGGVAHDFTNLLTAIKAFTYSAMLKLDRSDPVYETVSKIRTTAERGARLTRQLLEFSRSRALELEEVDLNRLIESLLHILKPVLGHNVRIETELAEGLDPVLANVGKMEQVIMNLVVNAGDAMPEGGVVTVSTQSVVAGEGGAAAPPGLEAGRYCLITVRDRGVGMDEETRRRIFEPFFTTKGRSTGTGLGLAVVYGIVKDHNGSVFVDSAPGEGSEFRVFLPALDPRRRKCGADAMPARRLPEASPPIGRSR
ncbi:MAG TPA: PAS domain S-box protein [Deltaproteobacteria bacterium]|nr:PAS domain S-box protein [Deltaproteobacteria bacterium]